MGLDTLIYPIVIVNFLFIALSTLFSKRLLPCQFANIPLFIPPQHHISISFIVYFYGEVGIRFPVFNHHSPFLQFSLMYLLLLRSRKYHPFESI